ncbi:hypothetical protein HaLaN_19295 [Haematococcus lacustris]|uniref:Uncharacterized protein n=1 Tax=Haematococcus lacustris TaxID=44745 RepID=A0A699ZH60_HAELA|nr:hypothetical protein HaLaN_19295 [Haematococcus lacustris]
MQPHPLLSPLGMQGGACWGGCCQVLQLKLDVVIPPLSVVASLDQAAVMLHLAPAGVRVLLLLLLSEGSSAAGLLPEGSAAGPAAGLLPDASAAGPAAGPAVGLLPEVPGGV